MATASRSRPPAGAKQRPWTSAIAVWLPPLDNVRSWIIPAVASLVIVGSILGSIVDALALPVALAGAILAVLVLLAYIGMRPIVIEERPARDRLIAGLVAAVWVIAVYIPFHYRLFPGTPLVEGAQMTAAGVGLPLRIPAAGRSAVDLVLEGKLAAAAAGSAAPPVHFHLTVVDASGGTRTVEGMFEDTLRTRRLGRRGSAVVHQSHTADVRVLDNPGRGDLTVTNLTLEPTSADAITLTAFAHPLPGPILLGLIALVLLAGAAAFDRLGPAPETDGALTLSTAAVFGTALIFWTSNAVHPGFQTLLGSAIFGGSIGFAAGALVWWTVKRVIVRPTP
jgi:hypothetical protein